MNKIDFLIDGDTAPLQLWHNSSDYIRAQYLKTMVDQEIIDDMILSCWEK